MTATRRAVCLVLLLVAAPAVGGVGVAANETATTSANGTTSETTNASSDSAAPVETDAAPPLNGSNGTTRTPQVAPGLTSPLASATSASERVTVVLETRTDAAPAVTRAVRNAGGAVSTTVTGRVQATLPRGALAGLAARPDVTYVRRPVYPEATSAAGGQGRVVSDALDNMNVSALHRNGITGTNTTVAVVGLRFNASNPEIAGQVATTKSFGSGEFDATGTHGTAVAELVVDTAPNATVLLVDVDTGTDFARAAEWIASETDADVAVASLGIKSGPFNGQTALGRGIRAGVRNGTQWVISAGNAGNFGHLNTTWRDGDGDRWLNFTGQDETATIRSASGRVSVTLNWNDWPYSSDDYDAYLQAWNGSAWTTVASSTRLQTGSQPPYETLRASGYSKYRLFVRDAGASGSDAFNVFLSDGSRFTEHGDRLQSITRPAVVDAALSVGAVRESTNALEAFSSRGPTVDGVLKPELLAPDRVDTTAYDTHTFPGTSAAAPHAAGVVALLVDASDDHLGPAALRERLLTSAWQLHAAAPNNRTGYGLVDAEGAVDALSTVYREHCAVVDAGGRTVLTGNATAANGTCMRVTGDDVALRGNGHRVATTGGDAVRVVGAGNVTVTNATLAGALGVNATGSVVRVRNVTFETTTAAVRVGDGARLNAGGLAVANTTVAAAGQGFLLANATAPNVTLPGGSAPYLRVAPAGSDAADGNLGLGVRYAEADVGNESRLRLWHYDGARWRVLDGTVHSEANAVTARLSPRTGVVTVHTTPTAAVTPASLDFGDVAVGKNATRNVMLTNTGNAPLSVENVTATQPAYTVTATPNGTLSPGENATIGVRFAPTASGAANATLTVAYNGPGANATATLTGTGVGPEATIRPTSHDFGTTTHDTSERATVTVANTGNRPLNVSNATLVPARQNATATPAYALANDSTPTVLAPGANATLAVLFTPERVGPANATLRLAHNATGSPARVGLSGRLPNVTVTSASLDFGRIGANETSTRTVTLVNNRERDLTLDELATGGEGFGLAALPNRTLAAGERLTLNVTFDADALGTYTGTLRLSGAANGRDVPIRDVRLVGERVDETAPTVSNVTAWANASDLTVGLTSTEALATLTVTLTGPENATLTRDDFTVADGRYTATHANASAGTYTVTLRTAADAAGNDGVATRTRTVTVERTDTTTTSDGTESTGDTGGTGGGSGFVGGAGGGGLGGGAVAPSPSPSEDPTVSTTDTAAGVNATVYNATATQPLALNFSADAAASDAVAVRALVLSLTPSADDTVRVSVGDPAASAPDSTPALAGARSYFTVTTRSLSEEAVESARIRVRAGDALRAAPGSVTLYHYHDGAWRPLDTARLRAGVYTAETPGFSAFAVASTRQTAVRNVSVARTTVQAGDPLSVRATVVNRGASAANRTLTVTANGSVVAERRVSLAANESQRVTLTVSFLQSGTYALSVEGTAAGTVRVRGNATTNDTSSARPPNASDAGDTDPSTTSGGSPGFGPAAALLGVVLAALAAVRRRRR
ncbi:choice-of-anchor D domain-containing protein [Halarchaeum sp. P4]|uniref:choice-of-anchor D domain-containing protein n=1 Tax=Halarchaeum sp. P4 TaxID=3421639 RepID=UPI003EB97432